MKLLNLTILLHNRRVIQKPGSIPSPLDWLDKKKTLADSLKTLTYPKSQRRHCQPLPHICHVKGPVCKQYQMFTLSYTPNSQTFGYHRLASRTRSHALVTKKLHVRAQGDKEKSTRCGFTRTPSQSGLAHR